VDFLSGLVAPIVGVLSLNSVNKLCVLFTFLSFTFCAFYCSFARCWNIRRNICYLFV